MFKKPKRNFRARDFQGDDNEEGDDKVETDPPAQKLQVPKKAAKEKKAETVKQSMLSFGEDWDEGDDGEVFKVKKSAQSKKIKKQMTLEKKKKKEPKPEIKETKPAEKVITVNDAVTIKIKNPIAGPVPGKILNGREAEVANYEGSESDEEDGPNSHKFSHPDHVKFLLKSGHIPDANLIHEARKRRQKAREMGDFIPLEESAKTESTEDKSRLIREDAEDSEEEERINMAGIRSQKLDKQERREAFDAAQQSENEEDLDGGEEDEWENQQIRKAVSGAQLAAVQQESMFMQQYMNSVQMLPQVPSFIPTVPVAPVTIAPTPDLDAVFTAKPLVFEGSSITQNPQSVVKLLRERLTSLEEVHRRHKLDRDALKHELQSLAEENERCKAETPNLAQRFRFYQDLRGYVTDLVECLDEKIPILVELEQRMLNLYGKRAQELISRRRQDVKDQAEELSMSNSRLGGGVLKRDEVKARRAAEREGRRIRRVRARETKSLGKHVDGMSSDDEVTEREAANFRSQKETIEQDAVRLFEDVVEDFSSVGGALRKFNQWRTEDKTAYCEAYVSITLPRILAPFIRLDLVSWNPLLANGGDLDQYPWYKSLMLYGVHQGETEEMLKEDVDVQLVPRVIEKIIIPKLTQLISSCWDPMSNSQTLLLVTLLTHLIQDHPTLGPESKLLTSLFGSVIDKMKDSVENDVYIPIYTKQTMETNRWGPFFQRQFASAVKLLTNLVRWQGLISDTLLGQVAIDPVLNRYLLMSLRTLEPIEASIKCHTIVNVLPRVWLHPSCPLTQLKPFLEFTKTVGKQMDSTSSMAREALNNINKMLKYAS
nr:PREDICTED: PAX3- and PAX7-binding protein 1 [Bemisia tabaci]